LGKALLFALLAVNTSYFAMSGATSKALDAAAWLTLLALFEAENRLAARTAAYRADRWLRAARLVAAAGVCVATARYFVEGNVLDALNSVLWIGVVVLLESELRYPAIVVRGRGAFVSAAAALYGGLAVLVLIWALRGEWFDAYDAALWIVAFATLELDVLRDPGATQS
jgi:hypothetical protein